MSNIYEDVNINLKADTINVPTFKEKKSKKWVGYGDNGKDGYAEELLRLYYKSSLHKAIVDSKALQVTGEGFVDKNGKAISKLESVNSKGESMTDIISKMAIDNEISGGSYALLTWSRNWNKVSIEHIDFSKVRVASVDDNGNIPGVYYAFDWTKHNVKGKFIPIFDPDKVKTNARKYKEYEEALMSVDIDNIDKINMPDEKRMQVVMFRKYSPGSFYYPIPEYVGAMDAIEASIQSCIYARNTLKNGMDPGLIFNIKSNASGEVKMNKGKELISSYTGAKNSGKIMINLTGPGEESPEILQLKAPDVDKRYVAINNNSLQHILSGHRITSRMLVGLEVSGQLGGSNELSEAQELFYNTVIKPKQNSFNKFFKGIFKQMGIKNANIKPINPISFTWSDEILKEIMTINELREKVGLQPMEDDENTIATDNNTDKTVVNENETDDSKVDVTENNVNKEKEDK